MRSADKEDDATCLHNYGKLPLTCNATIKLTANFYDSNPLVLAAGITMLPSVRHHSRTDTASHP